MATATRKKKTVDDLKADLAAAKAKVAALEQKAYKSELSELIGKSHFAADYTTIKNAFKDVSEVAILMEIAKACGAKRIHITQTEPKPRATKSKMPGAVRKTAVKKSAVK
jgi:uncharacterized protein YciW